MASNFITGRRYVRPSIEPETFRSSCRRSNCNTDTHARQNTFLKTIFCTISILSVSFLTSYCFFLPQKAQSKLIGLMVVLGIGILFIIIFPIVGCCFCCCRLFCKCCCNKPDTEDPNASCKRKVYGVLLVVFIALTL